MIRSVLIVLALVAVFFTATIAKADTVAIPNVDSVWAVNHYDIHYDGETCFQWQNANAPVVVQNPVVTYLDVLDDFDIPIISTCTTKERYGYVYWGFSNLLINGVSH